MKITKTVLVAALLNLSVGMAAHAQDELSEAELREIAVETCQTSAKARYGDDSIVGMEKRAKWKGDLNGVMVKMRIKAESKPKRNYFCVVKTDKSVSFFKA